jgi:hypothetical protein
LVEAQSVWFDVSDCVFRGEEVCVISLPDFLSKFNAVLVFQEAAPPNYIFEVERDSSYNACDSSALYKVITDLIK